jgi:hypothetical protein
VRSVQEERSSPTEKGADKRNAMDNQKSLSFRLVARLDRKTNPLIQEISVMSLSFPTLILE